METPMLKESTVERGQWLMSELLKQPVKDAVREALAEERARTERPEAERQEGDVQSDEESRSPVGGLLVGLAVAGVVAYLLRKRGGTGGSSSSPTRPSDVDESTAAGDRIEDEAPAQTEG